MGFDKQATRAIVTSSGPTGVVRGGHGPRIEWTLDPIITAWLHAKYQRSKSVRTEATYRSTLASYRATLHQAGLDLDSLDDDETSDDVATLATLLQGWAAKRIDGTGDVSASLFNQRVAIISSFYAFAHKKGYAAFKGKVNPADTVDRAPSQDYKSAKAPDDKLVKKAMGAIDRTTLAGARDYALLAVALRTGRRLSEIAAMRRRDLSLSGESDDLATITFPHAKGGKWLVNKLDAATSGALLAWLHAFYGEGAPGTMAPDAPIWVSLAHGSPRKAGRGAGERGEALGIRSLANICEQRMGVKKFHALRHAFAHKAEGKGAKVSEIQAMLGHSNIATTSRYLARLEQNEGENAYGAAIADDFGITAAPRPRRASTTRPLSV